MPWLLALLALVLMDCTFPAPLAQPTATIGSVCHYQADGMLPDPRCTPGAINPDVTQDNLQQTICRSSWTRTIRPPVSYTEPLKRRLMADYGDLDSPANYELDHLISLEWGGSPRDPANLWPESYPAARDKDRAENRLHELVCAGQISLQDAQQRIATDWRTAAP